MTGVNIQDMLVLKVSPKEGVCAGTYTMVLSVKTDDNPTLEIPVTLTLKLEVLS